MLMRQFLTNHRCYERTKARKAALNGTGQQSAGSSTVTPGPDPDHNNDNDNDESGSGSDVSLSDLDDN